MSKIALTNLLCMILLASSACKDEDLAKVARSLKITADTIGVVQTQAIKANDQGLLTTDQTRAILETCLTINLAGKQAVAVTRQIDKLDPTSKEQLLQILKPIIAGIQNSIDQQIIPISDPATRANLQGSLMTIQTALNAAIIIMAASGG